MRNYVRVVTVVVVCLLPAVVAKPAAAVNQNFGPAPREIAQSETPKAPEPKAVQPATPKPAPAPKPVAVVTPATDSAELKKLQAELDAAHAEAAQAKKNAARLADLEKENKELNSKLADAEKKANVKPPTPSDSPEVKRLRGDLDTARKDSEQAKKKSDARIAELQKQNADLSTKLSAAEKSATSAASSEAPDARVMKRLREENSRLRYLLDTYAAKNPELKSQLHRSE